MKIETSLKISLCVTSALMAFIIFTNLSNPVLWIALGIGGLMSGSVLLYICWPLFKKDPGEKKK